MQETPQTSTPSQMPDSGTTAPYRPLADNPPPTTTINQNASNGTSLTTPPRDQSHHSTFPSTNLPDSSKAVAQSEISNIGSQNEKQREVSVQSNHKDVVKSSTREGRGSKWPSVASLPNIDTGPVEQNLSGSASAAEKDTNLDSPQLDEQDAQALAAAESFEHDMAALEELPECGIGGWLTGKTLPDPYPYRHFHSIGMPAASRKLAWKWHQSTAEKNKRKLMQVASSVDCKPPRKYQHLQQNLKRTQMQEGSGDSTFLPTGNPSQA